MKHPMIGLALAIAATFAVAPAHADDGRWSKQQAATWYAKQAWPVGSNYLPADAINELEMWQADTFDPARIDKELGWAQQMGMTTMRVFLHDLLWKQDAEGFKRRIDTFLALAAKHHIKPILVLFAITVSLFYHLAAGVRHLFWDGVTPGSFQPRTADMTAIAAFAFGIAAAVAVWAIAFSTGAA